MATFAERVQGAAMLDARTFEEVEADETALSQALIVVVGAAVSSGLASLAVGLPLTLMMIVMRLIAWGVWAVLVYVIGTKVMPEPTTRADFQQVLRTIGFAAAPGLLGILAIIPFLGVLIAFALGVWQLVAMVIAVRQVLDYTSTPRAVAVCLIGFVVYLLVTWTLGAMFVASALVSRALGA